MGSDKGKGEGAHTEHQFHALKILCHMKDKYDKPKLPMVFLHGLFGFSVLGPSNLPAFQIQYWRGVREALEELGVEVLMTASPASGSKS